MKVNDTRGDCDLAGHTLLQSINVKAVRSASDTADVMTAIRGSTILTGFTGVRRLPGLRPIPTVSHRAAWLMFDE